MCIRDRLYNLIYKDYMGVWEESGEKLDIPLFCAEMQEKNLYSLSSEERVQILLKCSTPVAAKQEQRQPGIGFPVAE